MELISSSRPFSSRFTSFSSAIISSAMRSVDLAQASTTLLYFSPRVIRPSAYCCSNSSASFLVSATIDTFLAGMMMSSLPKEMPALAASRKPRPISWSANTTVAFWPVWR